MLTKSFIRWKQPKVEDRGFKRSFYRKILPLIICITCIPGLAIGIGIYWTATGKIESELHRLHQNQIKERAKNIDDQFAYLELTLSHWTFDPKFDQKLKDIDFVYKYDQVQELYRTMLVIEGSHTLIDKAEFYLKQPKPLTMNKELYTFLSDDELISKYNNLLSHGKTIFWTDAFQNTGQAKNTNASLTLVTKFPGGSTEPFGMLITSLNQSKLGNMLKTLTPYDEGSTILMNESGSYVTGDSKPTELDQAVLSKFQERQGKDQSFRFDYKNLTYSVSSRAFTRLGTTWIYLSATPLTAITSPVIFISKLIIIISLVGVFLALLFSWLASKRLYTPIDRLVNALTRDKRLLSRSDNKDEFDWIENHWNEMTHESEKLRDKLEQQMPLVREGFTLQLVQGYLFSYSEHDIKERLKYYGREIDGHSFIAVMVQLRGLSNLEGKFTAGDEELVSFAAANIAVDLTKNRQVEAEIINFHDLSIGILIMVPPDSSTKWLKTDLHDLCSELIQFIQRILKLEMTISISSMTPNIKHISYLFEEARQALSYREPLEGNQIIDMEQLNKNDSQQKFSYSFSLEKEIIHSIRLGSEDEAAVLIEQFLKELTNDRSTELIVQQGMLQLLGSVLNAMMHSGMNPVHTFKGANLFEELSAQKGPDDMLKWFRFKVVRIFVQELISKQDFHLKKMVEQVMLYLNEKYMTDLSLDSCADHFGTSPYTLSRAFKQITGINFIDYLTNIRLQNAKQMLRDSDQKIAQVAESVGYQQSYFNRIFKKYEGVTPSQYREMIRDN